MHVQKKVSQKVTLKLGHTFLAWNRLGESEGCD